MSKERTMTKFEISVLSRVLGELEHARETIAEVHGAGSPIDAAISVARRDLSAAIGRITALIGMGQGSDAA